jgi:TIR domain
MMATKVFISYRRDDSAGHAGRVHDRLEREFGRDLLFMDVDAVPLGDNFVTVLSEEVAKCDVLLAVIGPNWLNARDEDGSRRLDNPHDFRRVHGCFHQPGISSVPQTRHMRSPIEERLLKFPVCSHAGPASRSIEVRFVDVHSSNEGPGHVLFQEAAPTYYWMEGGMKQRDGFIAIADAAKVGQMLRIAIQKSTEARPARS